MPDHVKALLEKLLERTREGTVRWAPDSSEELPPYSLGLLWSKSTSATSFGSSAFVANLPHSSIRLQCFDVGGSPDVIVFGIKAGGAEIQRWILNEGAPGWNEGKKLFEEVKRPYFDIAFNDIVVEAKVRNDEESRPVETSAKEFFAFASGDWALKYERDGKMILETLRIDSEGKYYLRDRADKPHFLLRDVFYDPKGLSVVFSKVYAQGAKIGKTLQIEVLRLAPDGSSMTGHAQRDGHKLVYTKVA